MSTNHQYSLLCSVSSTVAWKIEQLGQAIYDYIAKCISFRTFWRMHIYNGSNSIIYTAAIHTGHVYVASLRTYLEIFVLIYDDTSVTRMALLWKVFCEPFKSWLKPVALGYVLETFLSWSTRSAKWMYNTIYETIFQMVRFRQDVNINLTWRTF